ncbi:putative S-layer protein [Candidatus Pacearchaeota archaeon]|nr:putative S-layer protein [Candidatus Pacearchaeota archaeon]
MAKNTFAVFGIFALLLVSLTMVSAAHGFTLSTITELPEVIVAGEEYTIEVNFDNANNTYDFVNVSFEGNNDSIWTSLPENTTIDFGENENFMVNITIPAGTYEEYSERLTVYYYNGSEKISHVYQDLESNTKDITDPVITLVGANPQSIVVGEDYAELGATADDSFEGNLTANITIDNTDVNTSLIGTYTVTYTVEDSAGNSATKNRTVNIIEETYTICDVENLGNDLSVEIKDINVEEGFGDDEDYWYPLDFVEIEVEVKNKGYDMEDIEMIFCLYDVSEDSCVLDEDDVDFDEDNFDLDDNDDQTIIITFQVDPEELSENKDYQIVVGAKGTIDDSDASEAIDGEDSCFEDNDDIEIRTDEEFVILNNIEFESLSGMVGENEFLTGSKVKISGEIWNVGDKDIKDDEIFLEIYNNALRIDEIIEFDSGIDALDKELFEITVTIPVDAEYRDYKIKFTAYDDEKMASKHIYENKENDKAEETKTITIQYKTPSPSISPTLESATVEGTELVVKTIITNNGDSDDFKVFVSGYESWATLVSITPETATIAEGEEVEVTVVLMPTESGMQSFKIGATVDGETFNQPVTVNIKGDTEFFGLSGMTLYLVAGISGMLILILVVLIVKVSSKRPAKAQF